MSKFWQKKYTSKYSGKEIDDAIGQVIEGGGGITFNDESRSVDKIALNVINVGDAETGADYIPGCTDVVSYEVVQSIVNETLGPYTKHPSVNFNKTVAGATEAIRYNFPYVELLYTPKLTSIQTLLTTGTCTEICAGLIKVGEQFTHYAAVLINLAGSIYTLNYAGTADSIDTYKGFFAVKGDAQLGTGIALVTLNIQSVNDTTTLVTDYDFIAIS